MKTVEELKGMTQEELILLVQELNEANVKKNEDSIEWYNRWRKSEERFENLRNTLKGIVSMIE